MLSGRGCQAAAVAPLALVIGLGVVGSVAVTGAAWSRAGGGVAAGQAEAVTVSDSAGAKRALASAAPGQTLVFADGDYDLGRATLTVAATEGKPLVLRAKNGGKARLVGRTGFVLRRAAFVTVEGFDFATEDTVPVQIQGSHNVRVTQNRFRVRDTGGAQSPVRRWVDISGVGAGDDGPAANSHHNRVDHNLFDGKNTPGNYIGVGGLTAPGQNPQSCRFDRIDHNYLKDIGPRIPNGMEAIRVGVSGFSLSSGNTIVEDNLFERCDGDPEVVSIKTCDAIIRNNTFRANEGGLCLRHGNRNTASGNVFLGEKRKGTDGVRVYGDDHRITGNYFSGLTGPALFVTNGNADYGVDYTKGELPADKRILSSHVRPRRITFAQNVVVDCARPIVLGTPMGDRTKQVPSQDIRFEKNTVFLTGNAAAVQVQTPPERLTWQGNMLRLTDGATLGLPGNVPPDGILLAANLSRPRAPRALTAADVGPDWLLPSR
jgi:hypothetical protein